MRSVETGHGYSISVFSNEDRKGMVRVIAVLGSSGFRGVMFELQVKIVKMRILRKIQIKTILSVYLLCIHTSRQTFT